MIRSSLNSQLSPSKELVTKRSKAYTSLGRTEVSIKEHAIRLRRTTRIDDSAKVVAARVR